MRLVSRQLVALGGMSLPDSPGWDSCSKAMCLCHCCVGTGLAPRLSVALHGGDLRSMQENGPGRLFVGSVLNRALTQGISLSWQARDPS